MNPFTVKDIVGIILILLSKKDRYSFLLSLSEPKNLFSNVEFYELVGWQVLADEDHEEGIKYFKRTKALQEFDILLYYFDSDQPKKLENHDFLTVFSKIEDHISIVITSKSYEMMDLIFKTLKIYDFNINNLNSLKHCHQNNFNSMKYTTKNNINLSFLNRLCYLGNMDCLKFILDNYIDDHKLLKAIKIECCIDLELFRFLEDIKGTEAIKEEFKNNDAQVMLLDNDNPKFYTYIRNKYEVKFETEDILAYAIEEKPLALELLKEIDVHSLDLSKFNCKYYLKYNFPLCKKIFSEKQIQYLLNTIDITIISDEKKYMVESMEMIYEYDPNKAKELFFYEIVIFIQYSDTDFVRNSNSIACRFLKFGVTKGWLSSQKDRNDFLYKTFGDNSQHKLFLFCTIVKMIDPRISIENVIGYEVRKDGFDLIKRISY